jgi:hypothetical protein
MMLMHDDACCMMMRDSLCINEQAYDVQHDAAEHPHDAVMGNQLNKFCFILFYFFRVIGIRNFDPRLIHSRPVCCTV